MKEVVPGHTTSLDKLTKLADAAAIIIPSRKSTQTFNFFYIYLLWELLGPSEKGKRESRLTTQGKKCLKNTFSMK